MIICYKIWAHHLYTIFEELVSKTSYIHSDMLLICIHNFLLQLK